MLRLGHIDYSNCVPVHSLLLEREAPPGITLRHGVPTELNAELAAARIDVAPCSSIEYARHAPRYRLLPGLAIASRGAVGSILLETERPLTDLARAEVALPSASASSVVLLRLLLEKRLGVHPRYRWFDQSSGDDPFGDGAAAALWIGDVALRRAVATPRHVVDLGEAWTEWMGLPFVYALWQTSAGPEKDGELISLHGLLLESLSYFSAAAGALADRHAPRFGVAPQRLLAYWRALEYRLPADAQDGLLKFFRLAAELGEAPAVPRLRWVGEP